MRFFLGSGTTAYNSDIYIKKTEDLGTRNSVFFV